MPNLREAIASTALASLEWSEERERAIDRVAASGKVSRLGLDLWKAKYMLEAQAYQDARIALVKAFSDRYKAETEQIAIACVDEALHEYLGPGCKVCLGAKELTVENLRIICNGCDGSGLQRYTDYDRAKHMQLSMGRVRLLAGKLTWLSGELGSLDRGVNAVLAVELERA